MTSTVRFRLRAAFALVLLLAGVVVAPAQAGAVVAGDWSQFRNGPAHVGSNPAETALSTATVARLRQKWVNGVSGSVWSSPTVAGGVLYVGDYEIGQLVAIDVASGRTLWRAPGDAVTGDWTFTTPAVAGGVVYLGINRPSAEVRAFDAATGATLWHVTASVSNIVGSPTVVGDVVYAATTEDQVLALDAKTGTRLWDAKPNGGRGSGFYTAPSVVDGVVYVTSLNHRLYALRADTGAVAWSFATGGVNSSTPAVANGHVYFTSWDGHAYAVNAATGAQEWRFRMGGTSAEYSSPALAGGVVYVGSNGGGRVYALDAATGRQVWSARSGATLSSPAVANGVVYVGAENGTLHAYTAATGRRLWTATLSGAIDSGPSVANGMVFAGTYGDVGGGNVYAFGL